MSKHLADLLGNDHPLFRRNLAELEHSSGDDGVDTHLLADCIKRAHDIMRKLGLDTADTSAEELYHALNTAGVGTSAVTMFTDTQFVLLNIDDELVSFNLYDIIENAHHELAFAKRHVDHAQRNLRLEVVSRYAKHERTNEKVVHDLTREAAISIDDDLGYAKIDKVVARSNDTAHQPSILAIGDIFTDAFIKLDEDYAHVEKDENGEEWLKLPFGSKPPYERVDIVPSVGPSPNSAISFARLGLKVSLLSWLGDDEPGKKSLEHLRSESVNIDAMVTEKGKASSYWYVLRHGTDRTMLVKSETYAYEWTEPVEKPDWVYLAYIGEDSFELHQKLLEYLEQNPDITFVLQPATYHFKWGTEKMAGLYRRANYVIMNREEAMDVTGLPREDIGVLADGLHQLGPEVVAITDGSHGSYVSGEGKLLTIQNYPDPAPPLDRTGAGDAFASTFIAAIVLGKSLKEATLWAPINSASVVQKIGAQEGLLTMDMLKKWLDDAPDDYKVTEIK